MTKNGPGATSDRFFGEMRDSVNTLVITIHSKGSHGPELTKKRLRERFWVTENGGENGATEKYTKNGVWEPFWSILAPILAPFLVKNGRKNYVEKRSKKDAQMKKKIG